MNVAPEFQLEVQEVSALTDAAHKLPPMLKQYLDYKKAYPDALLFFQVGDFYELFFEDAVTVSNTLNLTLTSRDKTSANPIPMCGVPCAVVDGYLDRLVAAGFSIALVTQAAAIPGSKGMMPRFLERIVTPGIRVLGRSEEARAESYVAALFGDPDRSLSIAFSSVQSGVISLREEISWADLFTELGRIEPAEVILPHSINGKAIDRRSTWVRRVEQMVGKNQIKFRSLSTLESASSNRDLATIHGYSTLSTGAKTATRLLVEYIDETTVSSKLPIQRVEIFTAEDSMAVDATTRRNLELVLNSRDGGRAGTLLEYLDRSRSVLGARRIHRWLLMPLVELSQIRSRHESVAWLLEHRDERLKLQRELEGYFDLERGAARIELGAISPKELGALRDALLKAESIRSAFNGSELAERLKGLSPKLEIRTDLKKKLQESLADDPPYVANEGGIFREGFDKEIDRLRLIRTDGKRLLAEYEAKERDGTGINSLKVRFNNVIGYFIEITNANLAKVPAHYRRRQDTTGAGRFTTEELSKLENEITSADSKLFARERELFEKLRADLVQFSQALRDLAAVIAELDAFQAFAELAEKEDLVCPEMNASGDTNIVDGRHPVIAGLLRERFIPNSLALRSQGSRCAIITGPNMGGKSTFLRQAALITLMAQIGSFVPAKSASLGIVDRIFARLGASDNLAEGESTFMVEMREAAHILGHASARSLVLIDEVGRGTATADGLAIARAILEWLVVKSQCRVLFATHFHELTALADSSETIANLSVGSVEQEDQVIFTHQIQSGPANRSYGLEVANLAGLPAELLARARELLLLSSREQKGERKGGTDRQISIFSSPAPVSSPETERKLATFERFKKEVTKVDLNTTTPLAALQELAKLQELLK